MTNAEAKALREELDIKVVEATIKEVFRERPYGGDKIPLEEVSSRLGLPKAHLDAYLNDFGEGPLWEMVYRPPAECGCEDNTPLWADYSTWLQFVTGEWPEGKELPVAECEYCGDTRDYDDIDLSAEYRSPRLRSAAPYQGSSASRIAALRTAGVPQYLTAATSPQHCNRPWSTEKEMIEWLGSELAAARAKIKAFEGVAGVKVERAGEDRLVITTPTTRIIVLDIQSKGASDA